MYGVALAGLLLIPVLMTIWDMWDTYRTLHSPKGGDHA